MRAFATPSVARSRLSHLIDLKILSSSNPGPSLLSSNLSPLQSSSLRGFGGRRVRAAGLHFVISASIAAGAAALIFTLWYPPPFGRMAGGFSLFMLLMSVDAALGPVLTAVAAAPKKPPAELRRDIAMIVAVQAVAFIYGIYAISLARPVHLAFEGDHFRVISAANVDMALLPEAPVSLRQLPWTGPTTIAAAKPLGATEQLKSIELALAGFDISMIPRNWRSYGTQSGAAWNVGRPLAEVVNRYPDTARSVEALVGSSGHVIEDLRFLPIISRQGKWIAVIVLPDSHVVGYLPVDGFF